jgi:hypothetical protein
MKPQFIAAALGGMLILGGTARGEAPADFLRSFETEARQADPAFKGFSGPRGEQFFKTRKGGDWSCSSCHTDNPAAVGKHAKTDKKIDPLAPAANPERFTSAAKVAKWFRRNCNDTLGRECTAQEKGDVLSYLVTIRK